MYFSVSVYTLLNQWCSQVWMFRGSSSDVWISSPMGSSSMA